jgi:hypothetical protein
LSSQKIGNNIVSAGSDSNAEEKDDGGEDGEEDMQVGLSRDYSMNDTEVISAGNDPLTARFSEGMRIRPIDWVVMYLRENKGLVFDAIREHLVATYPEWIEQTRRNIQIRYDKMKWRVDEDTSLIPEVWRPVLLPRLGARQYKNSDHRHSPILGLTMRPSRPRRSLVEHGDNDDDSRYAESPPGRSGRQRMGSNSKGLGNASTKIDENEAIGDINGATKYIIRSPNSSTPREVALRNARGQLDYIMGLCNVDRHPEDWATIIEPPSQSFRYYLKLQREDWIVKSWQRLKSTPEFDTVGEANSWARLTAYSQTGLWKLLRTPPTLVEIFDDDGMARYRVDALSRSWVVAVDREVTNVEYAAWEVKLVNIVISNLNPAEVKALCSRVPADGTTLKTFKKLNEANEYAGVSFYERKINAENSKRINGLDLSDYRLLAQEREKSIQNVNDERRTFHMFGTLDADSAVLIWVQPRVLAK